MLFEEFIQSKEDWGSSSLLASMRAERSHKREGAYKLMSELVPLRNLCLFSSFLRT